MKTAAIIATIILISPIVLYMVGAVVLVVASVLVEPWLMLYYKIRGRSLPEPLVPPAVMKMGQ